MARNIRTEQGVVIGTSGNKYQSNNPIAKYLLRRFDETITQFAVSVRPGKIIEIGCGEGHITRILLENTEADVLATDISASLIEELGDVIKSNKVEFKKASLEESEFRHSVDLVVCCEVLEHLRDPVIGLEALAKIDSEYFLLSVPREPIWRILNFCRGAYVCALGNSPGHLQHWSKRGFIGFIASQLEVVAVASPLPWTVLLCRSRL